MRLSNRTKRMIVHQERNRAGVSLNLIPMIDILSVMVAFLLVYSTEVEVLQNTKGITIPESVAEQKPRVTVVIMVTPEELLVQGEERVRPRAVAGELARAPLRCDESSRCRRVGELDLRGDQPLQNTLVDVEVERLARVQRDAVAHHQVADDVYLGPKVEPLLASDVEDAPDARSHVIRRDHHDGEVRAGRLR